MSRPLALLVLIATVLLAATAPAQHPTERRNDKDGAAMVWVPAGTFVMGSTDEDLTALLAMRPGLKPAMFADERPRHSVTLDGFWIYQYEVTVAQFRAFCLAAKRAMPEQPAWSTDKHPVVNVTWNDAVAYATWAGGSLPTEAQWERAARGDDSRRFPWGDAWDEEKCNNYSDHNPAGGGYHGKCATPGGAYPQSASPFGAQDMAGNVWEWCLDYYGKGYYADTPAKNPAGPDEGELRVLRGGSWGSSSATIRSACRHADSPDATYHDDGGFRCVVAEKKK